MTNPYYGTEERRNNTRTSLNTIGTLLILFFIVFVSWIVREVVLYENNNLIPVWVDYEVKILDKDKMVFYKSRDVSDSLVFRCNTDIFLGTQAIEKLEYRLP